MRVLVACEFSGRVRDAFAKRGHDAWSCDILPTISPGKHIQKDVLTILSDGWDLMIAHPPCTHLTVAGSRFFKSLNKKLKQIAALEFVRQLLGAPIPRIALENPIGVISTKIAKPSQIIQPWWFGDPERKGTCLWLKGLPLLIPTNPVIPMVVNNGDSTTTPNWARTKLSYNSLLLKRQRSVTFKGIAEAMASQWGS